MAQAADEIDALNAEQLASMQEIAALRADLDAKDAEIDRLRHDLDRQMAIAQAETERAEKAERRADEHWANAEHFSRLAFADVTAIPHTPWRAIAVNAQALIIAAEARATAAEQRLAEVEEALREATANLCGAASAYRKHAARHRSVGRATADPLFTTRAMDFEKAADRACAALVALYLTAGAQRGETEGR
jgi:hypothetical protein